MKIKYINSQAGQQNLTLGEVYKVYEVSVTFSYDKSQMYCNRVLYRVLNDNGVLGLYPAWFFEIVQEEIDPNWVFMGSQYGFTILAKEIAYDYFWDDFFGDNEKSENARDKLLALYPELSID